MSTSSLFAYLSRLLGNVDQQTLAATIFLAVSGWIIALILQRCNVKHQHKVEILYDIYKQFVEVHKEVQNSLSQFGAQSISPFILMDCSMISFQVNLKSEWECLFDGNKKWAEFIQLLQRANSDFAQKYLNLIYIFEDWAAPLGSLLTTKSVFMAVVDGLREQIYSNLGILQMYETQHGRDWRKWDRKELEKILDRTRENTMEIGQYLHDLMVLIHNELVSEYFKQKRPIRKTLDAKYKVLTEKGITINLDKDLIQVMKINRNLLLDKVKGELSTKGETMTADYKIFLQSIADGKCPDCKNSIEVLSADLNSEGFIFRFICGHSWKGVSFQETVKVREALIIKLKVLGLGRFIKRIFQGYKYSGDPKLLEGVEEFMVVDREKNEYHQVVKDNNTGRILHEEHDLLNRHRVEKR